MSLRMLVLLVPALLSGPAAAWAKSFAPEERKESAAPARESPPPQPPAPSVTDDAYQAGFRDGWERRSEDPFPASFPELAPGPSGRAGFLEGVSDANARRGRRLLDVSRAEERLRRISFLSAERGAGNPVEYASRGGRTVISRFKRLELASRGHCHAAHRNDREICDETEEEFQRLVHDRSVLSFDPRAGGRFCERAAREISGPGPDAMRALAGALLSHLDTFEAQVLLLGARATEGLAARLNPILDSVDDLARGRRTGALGDRSLRAGLRLTARAILELEDDEYEAAMRILSLRELGDEGSLAIHSRLALALEELWNAEYQTYFDVGAGLAAATTAAAVLVTGTAVAGACAAGARIGAGVLTVAKVAATRAVTGVAATGTPAAGSWYAMTDGGEGGAIVGESAFLGFNDHVRKYESPLSAMQRFQEHWMGGELADAAAEAVMAACTSGGP